jgi:hypothetical protein
MIGLATEYITQCCLYSNPGTVSDLAYLFLLGQSFLAQ